MKNLDDYSIDDLDLLGDGGHRSDATQLSVRKSAEQINKELSDEELLMFCMGSLLKLQHYVQGEKTTQIAEEQVLCIKHLVMKEGLSHENFPVLKDSVDRILKLYKDQSQECKDQLLKDIEIMQSFLQTL